MIRIGKIAATHGLKGSVILVHVVGAADWLKKDDVLFVALNKGSHIPYFVTEARAAGAEEYIVNLDEVEDVDAARKLVGKAVFVKEEVLAGHADDSPLLWIGFNIVDRQLGSVGEIEDVLETGHQWLAKISYEGREVLVPLIDQMIVDVNVKNRFIRMDLPEGLLTL